MVFLHFTASCTQLQILATHLTRRKNTPSLTSVSCMQLTTVPWPSNLQQRSTPTVVVCSPREELPSSLGRLLCALLRKPQKLPLLRLGPATSLLTQPRAGGSARLTGRQQSSWTSCDLARYYPTISIQLGSSPTGLNASTSPACVVLWEQVSNLVQNLFAKLLRKPFDEVFLHSLGCLLRPVYTSVSFTAGPPPRDLGHTVLSSDSDHMLRSSL